MMYEVAYFVMAFFVWIIATTLISLENYEVGVAEISFGLASAILWPALIICLIVWVISLFLFKAINHHIMARRI